MPDDEPKTPDETSASPDAGASARDDSAEGRRSAQRERRAERSRKAGTKAVSKSARPAIIGSLVIILATAGADTGVLLTQDEAPRCPSHWHPAFFVVVNGQRVPFTNPAFYQLQGSVPMHVHDDSGIIHVEPFTNRCIPMEDLLTKLAMDLSSERLTLGPEHGALAGTYAVDANHPIQAFVMPYKGEWKPYSPGAFDDYEPGAGDRLLLTYGALDESTVASQQDQVPEPLGPFPHARFPVAAFIGITVIGLGALWMWRLITRST